jgi:triosephosphate isomerase
MMSSNQPTSGARPSPIADLRPLVVGNWKMFTNRARAQELATEVRDGIGTDERVRVGVCPPFPYLDAVGTILAGTPVALGAQNCHPEPEGAFTGEVSALMLTDIGCRYVILGHSERRHKLGETDSFINRKVTAALAAGLNVILCVGETLADRQGERTEAVLRTQFNGSLAGLENPALRRLVLAYEPVWAIGTGHNATPEQAQQAHAFLRGLLQENFGEEVGRTVPILYGGSVKADNAAQLLSQPDVNGGLIGGASLQADQFLGIVRAALTPAGT